MQTFRNSLSYLLIAGLIGVFYSTAGAQDDLILWFAFEGSGNVAEDASGNGNDGTIVGATRAPGKYGKGIAIGRNNQYVEISNILQPATTVAFWFKPNWDGSDTQTYRLFDANTGSIYYMIGKGKAVGDRETTFGFYLEDAADADFQDWQIPATEAIPVAGQWYHIATTWDFDAGVATFYINGAEVGNVTGLGQFPTLNANPKIGFNVGNNYMAANNGADGVIDEFLIYARVLSMQEIQEVMKKGFSPGVASAPSPANEATDVLRDLTLSWTPGEYAPAVNGHIVYLSESFADVNDGVGGTTQDASNYDPGRLEFNTTYYWRVDEVNAPPDSTVYKGKVWSFITEPIGYPIDGTNITATASSAGQANFGPEKTIDGSGLDENDLHSTQAEDMWLSDNEPLGPWLQYEFDKLYKLHEMWVWNSNQIFEGLFGFGMKDVAVEYSTNGTDWTALADVPQFTKAPGAIGYAHDTTVDFGGVAAKYVKITATSNWGGILPQYGLSEVRFFAIPVGARKPSPDSGAADVNPAMALTWRAGREAAMHNVYVSTDEQSVIDGIVPTVSVTDASYNSDLDLANTYYWRIDEVNDVETPTTWQGDVWSFSTAEYLVVDDFESYNNIDPPDTASHRIFESWLDGYGIATNGALVGYDPPQPSYAETVTIHGGAQAMPLFYNNTGGATYSEAERTFAVPQNWAKHGVRTLSLYFFGTLGNTGQLYIKINGTKIPYDGQADNITRAGWQPWNIDLTASGANLASVSSLGIGVDGSGAAGTLYCDDIRLYAYERQFVTPVVPNDTRLIGHWTFDGNLQDASGLGNHGTAGGDPTFVAGQMGQALDLDGSDYVIIDGLADDITTTTFTISAWIKTTQTDDGNVVASNDTAGSNHEFIIGVDQGQVLVEADSINLYPPAVNDNQWHFIAYVRDGDVVYIYVDGFLVGTEEPSGDPVGQGRWSIGQEWDSANDTSPSDFFTGQVDEVRVYNYALSHAETASLAGRTEPFEKPF